MLQEKASEETKAAAEPEAEAETATESAKDGGQAADAGQQQISAGPSPAVSGSTPTKPTDAPATSSKQGKGKAKVRHLCGECWHATQTELALQGQGYSAGTKSAALLR